MNEYADCIKQTINISQENQNVYIKNIINGNGQFFINAPSYASINFSPPAPVTNISPLNSGESEIGIVLGLKSDSTSSRTVFVNTSGLISVQ